MLRLLILIFLFSSCGHRTEVSVFGKNDAEYLSNPIRLKFIGSKSVPFYFVLRKDKTNYDERYYILVRWSVPVGVAEFDKNNSVMNFVVDDKFIMSFKPAGPSKIVAYDMNTKENEEECVYEVSRADLHKLARAKNVEVDVTGRTRIAKGKFSKIFTFGGFEDFLSNS